MLQKKSLKPGKEIAGHANHPDYDEVIEKKIDDIIGKAKSNEKAFEQIQELIEKTKETLKKEVFLGNKDVNDIFKK